MMKQLFVAAVMLLAVSGCGGAGEPEQLPEQPLAEVDTGVPQETAGEAGRVSAMACSLQTYIGLGSCHQTCNNVGTCSGGTQQWSCYAINYEHWKSSSGADQYRARSWEGAWVTKCQNTNPVNCPSFCG